MDQWRKLIRQDAWAQFLLATYKYMLKSRPFVRNACEITSLKPALLSNMQRRLSYFQNWVSFPAFRSIFAMMPLALISKMMAKAWANFSTDWHCRAHRMVEEQNSLADEFHSRWYLSNKLLHGTCFFSMGFNFNCFVRWGRLGVRLYIPLVCNTSPRYS